MFSRSKNPVDSEVRRAKRRLFWQKTRRRLAWGLAIGLVLHVSLNLYATVQLNRELEAIRQKGDPLLMSDMEPPAVPDAQNAAPLYKQAQKALNFTTEEKAALAMRESHLTPELQNQVGQAIEKNRKALDLTLKAAEMPQCRFPMDWHGSPVTVLFPYLAGVRELARLLGKAAVHDAKKGNRELALREVHALFSMTHHLSNEPFLIGFLVGQSIDGLANQALARVLLELPMTAAQARAFEASLPHADPVANFRRGLAGERVMEIYAFQSMSGQASRNQEITSDSEAPTPLWAPLGYALVMLWRPVLKLDEVQTLRLWREMLDTPGSQEVPRSDAFRQRVDQMVQDVPRYAMLTRILFPVFNNANNRRDAAMLRNRQREVALALACYRTAKGQYPDKLDEVAAVWGKPLPLDFYSGKTFVYKKEGTSFLLYSVGVNRKDDGGKTPYSEGHQLNSNKDDLVWANSSAQR